MTFDKQTKILIIGLGVIGGGYAAALKNAGHTVWAITKDEKDIKYALDKGIIDFGTTEIDEKIIKSAELIVFALYPTVFIEWMQQNSHLLKSGTLITDVSGVKGSVVKKIQSLLPEGIEFISAHPMAGRESSGVEYSDASVFKGANYIITPTEKNTKEAIDICRALGETLGFARITELSVEEHDKMIAFLSQLTHCIAVTLMNSNTDDGLEKYTGDSFRDLTRIAKINDRMWSELFLLNKDALLVEMDKFIDEFLLLRDMLSSGNTEGMREKMRNSTARRTLFDKPSKSAE